LNKEDADYGFDLTHHAGSWRRGSGTANVPRVFAQQTGKSGLTETITLKASRV
jgi:hypothetical protein